MGYILESRLATIFRNFRKRKEVGKIQVKLSDKIVINQWSNCVITFLCFCSVLSDQISEIFMELGPGRWRRRAQGAVFHIERHRTVGLKSAILLDDLMVEVILVSC